MKIYIITIHPQLFTPFCQTGIIDKAITNNLCAIEIINLRDYATPPHYKVDDTPCGGGAGMILKPEVISNALEHIKQVSKSHEIIYASPRGCVFTQQKAEQYSTAQKDLIFVCGRFEGTDERVIHYYNMQEISIGDFITIGGEIPVMAISETIIRLLPNVLGNTKSLHEESFTNYLLEYPQYTKPVVWNNIPVPPILLTGHHEHINKWRQEQSVAITKTRRPDLLRKHQKIEHAKKKTK